MAPYYIVLCDQFSWKRDDAFLERLQTANQEKIKQLDEKITDAEENFGENEVREALLARAEYFCKIGSKVIHPFVSH